MKTPRRTETPISFTAADKAITMKIHLLVACFFVAVCSVEGWGGWGWRRNHFVPADSRCISAGGECKNTRNFCGGRWESGKCAGPSSRKCCLPRAGNSREAGGCELETYKASNVMGHEGKPVRIDKDFKPAMDEINRYAKACGVKVMVTSSYRRTKSVSGAIVTPATRSNHMVGHAIDMNLSIGRTWCNSSCLARQKNVKASCFTNKLMQSRRLRWGQKFRKPDPVHIDDNLNGRNPSAWANKYREMQSSCPK